MKVWDRNLCNLIVFPIWLGTSASKYYKYSDLIRENPTNMLDWLPERDPQVQLLNFLDSNGLLPLRYLYWIRKKKSIILHWFQLSISFCWLICYNPFGFLPLPLEISRNLWLKYYRHQQLFMDKIWIFMIRWA